jgi:hypothetical protein
MIPPPLGFWLSIPLLLYTLVRTIHRYWREWL